MNANGREYSRGENEPAFRGLWRLPVGEAAEQSGLLTTCTNWAVTLQISQGGNAVDLNQCANPFFW